MTEHDLDHCLIFATVKRSHETINTANESVGGMAVYKEQKKKLKTSFVKPYKSLACGESWQDLIFSSNFAR